MAVYPLLRDTPVIEIIQIYHQVFIYKCSAKN